MLILRIAPSRILPQQIRMRSRDDALATDSSETEEQ